MSAQAEAHVAQHARADRYVSTRADRDAPTVDFARALLDGLAGDGGLYLPQAWPRAGVGAGLTYVERATSVLDSFIGDALPAGAGAQAARRACDRFRHACVAPLVQIDDALWLLELFHGPTLAFKDCAMQLMAPLMDAALAASGETLLLVTATSGDTGAAAVNAFAGAERVSLAVFHPEGRVSPVQRRQMTTVEAGNVLNVAVRGDFDACQAIVKALLAEPALRTNRRVSSVNSINWGRLAGQIPYYLAASATLGRAPRFVVPTGNFGDAFAGWAARAMGADIGPLVAAVNQNDALARVINTGHYTRRAATPSASVSMDVQAPSNFERLVYEAADRDGGVTQAFYSAFARDGEARLPASVHARIGADVSAVSIDEAETARTIAQVHARTGQVICPHTAVGVAAAWRTQGQAQPATDTPDTPTVVLATAHPGKFPDAVAAALGAPAPTPPQLAALAERRETLVVIDDDLAAARAALEALS